MGSCHNVFRELVTCGKMVQKREKGFEIKYTPTEEEKIKTKLKSLLHQSNDKKKKKSHKE